MKNNYIIHCCYVFIFLFLFQFHVTYTVHLANGLIAMDAYAQSKPEYVNDLAKVHTYKERFRTFTGRLRNVFGFKKAAVFTVDYFEKLLKELLLERAAKYNETRLVQKIIPKKDSSFIIFGELNGAFHSLIRDVKELQRLGYIDNDLKLQSDDTYIIFNGNVIGESSYNVETITVALYLMYQNPHNVFYLKGYVEDKEQWLETIFAKQLLIDKHSLLSTKKESIARQLSTFFGTLPLALYVIPQGEQVKRLEVVRISYFNPEIAELDEGAYAYFFDAYTNDLISLVNKSVKSTEVKVKVASYVYVEDRKKEYTASKGLFLQSKGERGAWWSVVSSPTAHFRRLYRFFDDAFIIIKTADKLYDWTLSLYHQDVRKLSGFIKEEEYRLITGEFKDIDVRQRVIELSKKLDEVEKVNEQLRKKCTIAQESL